MIHYRIVVDAYSPNKRQPEFTHTFFADVEPGMQRPGREGIIKAELEDMAWALLVSRDMMSSGLLVSVQALSSNRDAPKRMPDMASSGISLWYFGIDHKP